MRQTINTIPPAPALHQAGGISVMFSVSLIALLAMCGLAIDMGQVYNRKVELRNIGHAIALGAAKKLNGTAGGVGDALAAAQDIAAAMKYRNNNATVEWSDAAISFASAPAPAAAWMSAASAAAVAPQIYYVRVDTSKFAGAGDVRTALMPLLSAAFRVVSVGSDVIAGRTSVDIAPLALCAMSPKAAASRNNGSAPAELVEYGFRRGVAYDLMQLNPLGTTPLNFVIDPLTLPGMAGAPAGLAPAIVGPHACAGRLGVPRVTGDAIAVGRPFPLAALYRQLNSRFDQYADNACTVNGAPPDVNIKAYDWSFFDHPSPTVTLTWLAIKPKRQSAASTTAGGRLETIADLPAVAGTAEQYGPIWAYARAVPYSAYAAGAIEPAKGYATIDTDHWPALYGGQSKKAYPPGTNTPYSPGNGNNRELPDPAHRPGSANRRVLNVPLLQCDAMPGASATVLAIGKFFMTVPATDTVLAAEFGGVLPLERVNGSVEIFQ